ncbi:MAG: cupin domain-containing protein [Acidobacteriota bacterium]
MSPAHASLAVATLIALSGFAVTSRDATVAAQGGPGPAKSFTSPSGTVMRVLVDAASLGGSEVEVAELKFAPNSDSGDHQHGVTETFYVLEGELDQVINGKPVRLGPGMVASIRSTDHVQHKTGPNGARVLVIWAPGGEIARVTARWRSQ